MSSIFVSFRAINATSIISSRGSLPNMCEVYVIQIVSSSMIEVQVSFIMQFVLLIASRSCSLFSDVIPTESGSIIRKISGFP